MSEKSKPFAQLNAEATTLATGPEPDVEHENYIVGNIEGLTILRDHIDEALRTGREVEINNPVVLDYGFSGVAIAEREPVDEKRSSALSLFVIASCLTSIMIPTLLCLGVWKIIELIF